MWILITFPQLSQKQKDHFNRQRQEVGQQVVSLTKEQRPDVLRKRLTNIDNLEQSAILRHSYGGRLGVWMECISKYAGFPWQANIALVGGFAAKEVILSTLSTAYSYNDLGISKKTRSHSKIFAAGNINKQRYGSNLSRELTSDPAWTLPAVISLFLFILLYSPCLVTVIAMAKETSWKWAIFGTLGSLAFAYALSVLFYQLCLLLEIFA